MLRKAMWPPNSDIESLDQMMTQTHDIQTDAQMLVVFRGRKRRRMETDDELEALISRIERDEYANV